MKTTVNFCDFTDAFRNMDRQDSYSYEGKKALFDFFEEMDDQCETETELDVIAICCEFSEYGSAVECVNDCGYEFDTVYDLYCDKMDDDEAEEAAIEYLNDNTLLITFAGGIIIQDF